MLSFLKRNLVLNGMYLNFGNFNDALLFHPSTIPYPTKKHTHNVLD